MSECEKAPADKHHLCTKEGRVVCPDVQRTTERHHPPSPLTLPHFTKTLQDIHHSYMQAPTRLTELPQTNCSESIKTTCTIQLTNYISLKYIGPTKSPTVQPRGEGGGWKLCTCKKQIKQHAATELYRSSEKHALSLALCRACCKL